MARSNILKTTAAIVLSGALMLTMLGACGGGKEAASPATVTVTATTTASPAVDIIEQAQTKCDITPKRNVVSYGWGGSDGYTAKSQCMLNLMPQEVFDKYTDYKDHKAFDYFKEYGKPLEESMDVDGYRWSWNISYYRMGDNTQNLTHVSVEKL